MSLHLLSLHSFLRSKWNYLFKEAADPRISTLPLMNDPITILLIITIYLQFVLKWGPQFMNNKKPYNLKPIIVMYNIIQVLINTNLFLQLCSLWRNYNWICQPLDNSTSESGMMGMHLSYSFFLNKILDLMDTVFFVLRKKQNQISFLHVWHHTIMVMLTWVLIKYIPGGHSTFPALINSFIHILLYIYYFMASLGSGFQKYLWWNKYLTSLQLVQFGLVVIHQSLAILPSCDFPAWSAILTLPNTLVFIILFSNFYMKKYKKII